MALFDAFLKIDGIMGGSTRQGHEGEIELNSFSFGLTNTGSSGTGGGEAGRVVFQDFHFTSKVGVQSPQLFLACASGKILPSGILTLDAASKSGKLAPDFKLTFSELLLTEYKVMDIVSLKLEDAVSSEGGLITSGPEDSASFSFGRVEVSSGGAAASATGG
jgi:type VI secretion system secreted protein Hcp